MTQFDAQTLQSQLARKPIEGKKVNLKLNQDGEFDDTFSSSVSGEEAEESKTQEESME